VAARTTKQVALSCSCLLILFTSTGLASAEGRSPPRVTLHHGDQQQRGLLWSSTWVSEAGSDFCGVALQDGRPTFGPALHVSSGPQAARIRLHKSLRPRHKPVIKAWTAVDADGHPLGTSHRLSSQLVKERHHGHQRWAAVIKPAVSSDLYISAFAGWNDPKSCSAVNNASWTFHIAP
jgi:hypothetical protein